MIVQSRPPSQMVALPHRQPGAPGAPIMGPPHPGMKRPGGPMGSPGGPAPGHPAGHLGPHHGPPSKAAKKKKKLADKILPQKVRELVPESQVREPCQQSIEPLSS